VGHPFQGVAMVENMPSIPQFDFDDSTVTALRFEREIVILELEDVQLSDDDLRKASIRLTGVHSIIRDGMAVDNLGMECEDGEVLTLEYTPKTLHLIVEWNDFKKHHSVTHSYKIECDSVEVEIH
jgi:hypothetical protein